MCTYIYICIYNTIVVCPVLSTYAGKHHCHTSPSIIIDLKKQHNDC